MCPISGRRKRGWLDADNRLRRASTMLSRQHAEQYPKQEGGRKFK